MAPDDPPRRKRDWRAPDTGRGPDVGDRPEVGEQPDVGEGPEVGRGPEVGQRPEFGKSPEVGLRPDTGETSTWGRGPEVGRGPDFGKSPEFGRGPDFGQRPDTGRGPDTSRIEDDEDEEPSDRLGLPAAAVLMLADARFPAGGHAHSGGLEAAVTAGTVSDVGSLELFLRGRLATAGVVAAGLAAAACASAMSGTEVADGAGELNGTEVAGGAGGFDGTEVVGEAGELGGAGEVWAGLDAEADARTPSPAQREASRRQGRALLRAARAAWPSAALDELAATRNPHHAIVLGAAAAAAGCRPADAAQVAAYLTVTGPASAAVRLLALDPIQVSAAIARLAGPIGRAAGRGARAAARAGPTSFDDLPYPSAPALDLYAEAHAQAEVRLFAS
jgi:urease accessory protein